MSENDSVSDSMKCFQFFPLQDQLARYSFPQKNKKIKMILKNA